MRSSRRDPTNLRLKPLAAADWLLAAAICLVPIGVLVAYSFGRTSVVTQDVSLTGTIRSYRTLFGPLYRPVLMRSITLSALTVALCVGLGTPAALAISRLSQRWRDRAVLALLFPSFVSFTVRIFAWQGLLGSDGPIKALTGRALLFHPPAVLIGMVATYVPLFVLPAYVAVARVGPNVLDAALDLGARRFRQTTSVTLPIAAPGVLTGAVVVGVLSLGEFVVPTVLGGGKVLLLGEILFERGATRDQPLGGAIVAAMLVMFAIVGAASWALRRVVSRHA